MLVDMYGHAFDLAYAFDLSNHQGPLTHAVAKQAWESGFRRCIVNTYGPYAIQQMLMAHSMGFEVQAYCYLNFPGGQFYTDGLNGFEQVTAALDKCDSAVGVPIAFMWLDFEDDGNSLDVRDTIIFMQESARACVNRKYSGVYTAPGWWKRFTNDTTLFAQFGYKLWLATDDDIADLQSRGLPFGGWAECEMEQYDFQGAIDSPESWGKEYDFNVYRVYATEPVPVGPDHGQPQEEDMEGFVEIIGSDNIAALNDAASGALGALIGNSGVGVSGGLEAFIRRNDDGTFDYLIKHIPGQAFIGLPTISQ